MALNQIEDGVWCEWLIRNSSKIQFIYFIPVQCQSVCNNCRVRSSVIILHENSTYSIIMNICIRSATVSNCQQNMQPTFCSCEPTIEFYCAINSVNVQHFSCNFFSSLLFFYFSCVAIQWWLTKKKKLKNRPFVCVYVWNEMKQRQHNGKTRKNWSFERNATKGTLNPLEIWWQKQYRQWEARTEEMNMHKMLLFFSRSHLIRLTLRHLLCFRYFSKIVSLAFFVLCSFAYLNAPQHA